VSVDERRVLLSHTSPGGPSAKHVRGSLIASSLQTLREVGLYDRYLKRLPATFRDDVLFALASSWLPMAAAEAHYQACEELELDELQMSSLGETVSKRIMGTYLGTLVRSGRGIGPLSPWLVLHQYHRVCERIVDGGVFIVTETGPKDALVETRGLPLFQFRYFRKAALGIFRGASLMFAKSCHARELPAANKRDQLIVGLSWV
jgi:hypothetical protein